jgi:hypothetical protein
MCKQLTRRKQKFMSSSNLLSRLDDSSIYGILKDLHIGGAKITGRGDRLDSARFDSVVEIGEVLAVYSNLKKEWIHFQIHEIKKEISRS